VQCHMSHFRVHYLRTIDVAKETGHSRRHVPRLAALGDIPGARRKRGGHWEFRDSARLKTWMRTERRRRDVQRNRPRRELDPWLFSELPQHCLRIFQIVNFKLQKKPLHRWSEAQRDYVLGELNPILRLADILQSGEAVVWVEPWGRIHKERKASTVVAE
jgi:hypothetical protein